ncbi:hypothetical protein Sp245p_28835 (plasmid) [Azospirillum baldaniorum]|uniref:Uncharacterized protein n=1 Tax=Azospirillum baldaniorum TaxID=1064539 RepID=A0A9P1NQG8_9PROT|nr:hypothetical protein [Azospirillum baldaniorum]AWJ93828.1 hypothetical protein Sp245p_28835 [Azospirillum baldaniorum]TWA81651.1 hypothetical protein FBZ85_10225 [Azospirillum brasilense]CCD01986.1 protein of unknown function [Azospirillum baldaniorum]
MNSGQRVVVLSVCGVVALLLHIAYWQWGWDSDVPFPLSPVGIGMIPKDWVASPTFELKPSNDVEPVFGVWARTAFDHAIVAGVIGPVLLIGFGLFVYLGRDRGQS